MVLFILIVLAVIRKYLLCILSLCMRLHDEICVRKVAQYLEGGVTSVGA